MRGLQEAGQFHSGNQRDILRTAALDDHHFMICRYRVKQRS